MILSTASSASTQHFNGENVAILKTSSTVELPRVRLVLGDRLRRRGPHHRHGARQLGTRDQGRAQEPDDET